MLHRDSIWIQLPYLLSGTSKEIRREVKGLVGYRRDREGYKGNV